MHATQVEPDSFAYNTTIVMAVQTGRFSDGGSDNICWSTSSDLGVSWKSGCLPGLTTSAGGAYGRVSDPSVAYSAKQGVWLISGLALKLSSTGASGIAVSRSTDGGYTWSNPVVVSTSSNYDKDWIVCDNTPASPFYGRCYLQWDDNGNNNLIRMCTSTDGGVTWGSVKSTSGGNTGLGGQPLVQPGGTVIVPSCDASCANIVSWRSTDGGGTWTNYVIVAAISHHEVSGNMRADPLPSAEIDGSGKVYVFWSDCRFRTSCTSNDIVYSTSSDGLTWSAVTRVPIDSTSSSIDHFIPGIGVNKLTSGSSAALALTFYYMPTASCTTNTCALYVGFVSSTDGGSTWTSMTSLGGPMSVLWLPLTTEGYMVGDYISTSFAVDGKAFPAFVIATAGTGSTSYNLRLSTIQGGISL